VLTDCRCATESLPGLRYRGGLVALAERCSSRPKGDPSAFGCLSIESLPVKVMKPGFAS
jgi:hypothetical protein